MCLQAPVSPNEVSQKPTRGKLARLQRSQLGSFTTNRASYLRFVCPVLRPLLKIGSTLTVHLIRVGLERLKHLVRSAAHEFVAQTRVDDNHAIVSVTAIFPHVTVEHGRTNTSKQTLRNTFEIHDVLEDRKQKHRHFIPQQNSPYPPSAYLHSGGDQREAGVRVPGDALDDASDAQRLHTASRRHLPQTHRAVVRTCTRTHRL